MPDDVERDRRFRMYLGAVSFGASMFGYALLRADSGISLGRTILETSVVGLALTALVVVSVYFGRRKDERDRESEG